MKKFYYTSIAIFSWVVFTQCSTTFAVQNVESPTDTLPSINSSGGWVAIAEIIKAAIGIVGILAIIAITWAWIQLFLSAGDEEKYKKSKSMMIFALIGVAIASGAYALVTIITNLKFWA